MYKNTPLRAQFGFTLIEMIVSLALFSVVVTVAIGALLMVVGANDELQGEQSVMTGLSFALDSMSREIRTGTGYVCVTSATDTGNNVFNDAYSLDDEGTTLPSNPNCPAGRGEGGGQSNNFHGLLFTEAGDSITEIDDGRILYYHDENEQMLYRRVGAEEAVPILADDIVVTNAEFFVTGVEPLSSGSDTGQPAVTIHIEARAADDTSPDPKVYFVQTTVTQRILDL